MNNVLNVNVGLYKNYRNNTGTEIDLFRFLTTPNKNFDLEKLRLKYPDKARFNKKVKDNLPAITPSGIFKPTRATDNLVKHTGLMAVDIDFDAQKIDMDVIFNKMKELNYIAYLGKSCGGKGLFGIMPIAYPEKHNFHFLSIEKNLLSMGIVIDTNCKDITRTRLYSYDADAYFNLNAVPYSFLYVPPVNQYNYVTTTLDFDDPKFQNMIADIQENHINIAESYSNWCKTATILHNELGEDGRDIFHVISSQSRKYDKDECDDMYDKMSRYPYPSLQIGTLYYMYNEAKKQMK